MANTALPTKADFIANDLVVLKCYICLDDFDKEHNPVQIPACGHFFGANCLEDWFKSDQCPNTCPLCRTELFKSEKPPETEDYAGSLNDEYEPSEFSDDEDMWLDDDEDFEDPDEYVPGLEADNSDSSEAESECETINKNCGNVVEPEIMDFDADFEFEPEYRRSTRIAARAQSTTYNHADLRSTIVSLNTEIVEYTSTLWISTYALIEAAPLNSTLSPPTIATRQLRDMLTKLPQPAWTMSGSITREFLVMIARKMVRRHKETDFFDPTPDLSDYVEDIRGVVFEKF